MAYPPLLSLVVSMGGIVASSLRLLVFTPKPGVSFAPLLCLLPADAADDGISDHWGVDGVTHVVSILTRRHGYACFCLVLWAMPGPTKWRGQPVGFTPRFDSSDEDDYRTRPSSRIPPAPFLFVPSAWHRIRATTRNGPDGHPVSRLAMVSSDNCTIIVDIGWMCSHASSVALGLPNVVASALNQILPPHITSLTQTTLHLASLWKKLMHVLYYTAPAPAASVPLLAGTSMGATV